MTEIHEDTSLLIDRMCAYVERKDFELDKPKAEECILKTYDLFGLPRPKTVVWYKHPFTDTYQGSAWSARSARSAESAAESAAKSAESAAKSAWSAAESAAESAAYEKHADKLIELLSEAR